jgi:hypothetical protein
MSSETRSRLDAALNATHESVQHLLLGWQRHAEATRTLNEAKVAAENELADIHSEIAEWHEKVNALLRPIVEQMNGTQPPPPVHPETSSPSNPLRNILGVN